jgi:hypothetical protein
MKKNYTLLLFTCLLFLNAFSSAKVGNYTIDSSKATSGTNFNTWVDFQQSIVSSGVSGMVYVDVLTDDLSNSQIVFAAIPGVSNANRILINGHGKKLSASISDAVILFDGADYLQIDSLHIENSSSNPAAIGIRFKNNSDYNTISSCFIELSGLANTSTNSGAYIAFADAANALTTASNKSTGSYNTLQYNVMQSTFKNSTGPSFGIVLKGSSATYSTTAQNNTVRGNLILNFSYMGIYMLHTNGNHLVLNDISRIGADSFNCSSTIYGIYTSYAGSTNRSNRIDSNHIHDLPKDSFYQGGNIKTLYGIYTYYIDGKDSLRFSIKGNQIRNLFSTQNCYVMYNSYNYFMDVIMNIADNMDVPVSTSSVINFFGIFNSYIYGSYRINANTIKNCDGGYHWYGVQNTYPRLASGVQQINENIITNNLHAYYYRYNIYAYYADKSDSLHQIEIAKNNITSNSTDNAYTYNIYCEYYGDYLIADNIIERNKSNHTYMYGLYLKNYGTFNVERNIIRGNTATLAGQGTVYGIYSDQNYEQHYLSNLIVENAGTGSNYGIYLSCGISGNYMHEIRQNTISNNGSLGGNPLHSAYPIYCNLPYSNSLNFIGNVIDILNSNTLYMYLLTNNTLNVQYNSYHVKNVNFDAYITTQGSDTGIVEWINFNTGKNELNAVSGHFFDTITYATKWFNNQNNVPSVAYNLSDVYGVARSASFSDRGAVEYSGATSVKSIKNSRTVCTLYPNPNKGDLILIHNPDILQDANFYDITGKKITTIEINKGLNSIENNLTKGIYIIYFSQSGQTLKLIVE